MGIDLSLPDELWIFGSNNFISCWQSTAAGLRGNDISLGMSVVYVVQWIRGVDSIFLEFDNQFEYFPSHQP